MVNNGRTVTAQTTAPTTALIVMVVLATQAMAPPSLTCPPNPRTVLLVHGRGKTQMAMMPTRNHWPARNSQ